MLPRVNEAQLAAAALSFADSTSMVDGLHPRQVAFISHQGLIALSWMFYILECLGDFPGHMATLLIRLLPKPQGGVRPIGLYSSLFRVWTRTRAD